MNNIKKVKNFDGIRASITAKEFDKIMYCLDCAIEQSNNERLDNFAKECEKVQRVLSKMSYFDTQHDEVHIQLGYSELSTLTNITYLFLPHGESECSYKNCIKSPECKKWTNRD